MNDYASIADLYDSYVLDTRDHAFWSEWASRARGPILEVMAGTGRATVALARSATGCVVALDLSPEMLTRLAGRFRDTTCRVRVVAGDAVSLPFRNSEFALVVVPFNSLGEIIDADQRAAALRELCRVLAPGGTAIVTLHDPSFRLKTLDGVVRRLGPFVCEQHSLEVLITGSFSPSSGIARCDQSYVLSDRAEKRFVEQRQLTLYFVLQDCQSLSGMAADVGLRRSAVFGDYDQSAYVPGTSPFIIGVFEK